MLKLTFLSISALLLSIFLTAVPTFGSDKDSLTTICVEFENIQFVSIDGAVNGTCQDFKVFDSLIDSVRKISPIDFKLGSLVVGPRERNNFGSENWELSSMTIAFDGRDTDWHKATLLIFPHEIGHLILDKFLSSKLPLLKDLDVIKQRNALYMKHLLPILQLRQRDSTCGQPESECVKKIKAMISAAPIDLKGPSTTEVLQEFFSKHKDEVEKLDSILVHYHELFADLVQALYFEDPAVNTRASKLFGIEAEPCRTFNVSLDANFTSFDPHCSLSEIRASLWENFVKPANMDKKQIITILAEAIYLEAEDRLQSSSKELSNQEIAKRLISRFKKLNTKY